jgi:hypothetical protein
VQDGRCRRCSIGYSRPPFAALVAHHPGPDVYPPDSREWGPSSWGVSTAAPRCRDRAGPRAHESIARRILVGEAGQRVQGFLGKLGIASSYVMINAFLYSVYGQGGGERHDGDPAIARDRHAWLDALLVDSEVRAVVALGRLAITRSRPGMPPRPGRAPTSCTAASPTFTDLAPGRSTTPTRAIDARRLERGPRDLPPGDRGPPRQTPPYGQTLADDDLAPIPDRDLPAGIPEWMRSLDAWASRVGEDEEDKRATLSVRVPTSQRPWHDVAPDD